MNEDQQASEVRGTVMNANAKATQLKEKIEDEVRITLGQIGSILDALVNNAFTVSDKKEKEGHFHNLVAVAEHLQKEALSLADEAVEMAYDLEQLNKGRSALIDRFEHHDWEVLLFVMDAATTASVTVKETAQAGLERFGAERAPSATTLETFFVAMSQYKGDRVIGKAGAENGAAQFSEHLVEGLDSAVLKYVLGGCDWLTSKELAQSCLSRFGTRRAPTEAWLEKFYRARARSKSAGDPVVGEAGAVSGAVPAGFRDQASAESFLRAYRQFAEGMKQQVPAFTVAHFDKCYDVLSESGACDCPGGGKYSRVLEEWLNVGKPEPVVFILYRANVSSDALGVAAAAGPGASKTTTAAPH